MACVVTTSTADSSAPPAELAAGAEVCGCGWVVPIPPLGYCVGDEGCVCATCCAIAGRATATAAQAISRDLVRIAPRRRTLGHRHLDRVGRLFLRNRGKKIERADNDDEQDDEHR